MKTVPHYHVEYVLKIGDRWTPHVIPLRDPGDAAEAERIRKAYPKIYDCVRVTGPHDHWVPA